jgi:hypothetical protein
MKTTRAIFVGALGGAILLTLFEFCYYSVYFRFVPLGGRGAPPIFQLALSIGLPLGLVLGAITYPGLLLIQSGQPLKAARLYLIGGCTVTFLLLGQSSYFIYLVMGSAAGGARSSTIALGHFQVPLVLYLAAQMLMFNLPLQWVLLLIGSGLWLKRRRRHDTW